MGKINGRLMRLFIGFNIKLAIIGVALICAAIQSSAYSHQLWAVGSPSLVWICIFGIGILSISGLGIYAGLSEKEIILKIFAGFMGVGMIIMLILGINVVVRRNKVKSSFDSAAIEAVKSLKENEELRTLIEELQQRDHCCGVVSASDWEDNIPDSCECYGERYGEYEESECTSKPWGVRGPKRIYKQPCSEIVFMSKDSGLETAMALCFGLIVIPVMGLLFSLLMIHQIRLHDGRVYLWNVWILRRPLTPDPRPLTSAP